MSRVPVWDRFMASAVTEDYMLRTVVKGFVAHRFTGGGVVAIVRGLGILVVWWELLLARI